jgi:hypothetical protein
MRIVRLSNTDDILIALKNNDNYCPCRRTKSDDTKCMCKEFREQESGICHCGLYEKILDD